MHFFALALLHSPRIVLPEGFTPSLQIVLRWIHLIAGITWVGLLYFFNLVNIPFMKEIDGPPQVMPAIRWIQRSTNCRLGVKPSGKTMRGECSRARAKKCMQQSIKFDQPTAGVFFPFLEPASA